MDFYYLQTFPHPPPALLQLKSFLRSQEKERLKPAEKANHPAQTILLQDLTLLLPEARDAHTTETSCMLAQEVAATITQGALNNM